MVRALRGASDARVYRRVAAVLAVADGRSVAESARQFRVDRTTVHRWVASYVATRDPNALADAERAAAADQGREQRRRFLAPGSGYQPGMARMFNN